MTRETIPSEQLDIIDAEIVAEESLSSLVHLPFDEGVGSFYARAQTIDDLLADVPDTKPMMEYTGRAMTIHGASLHKGDLDGRSTVFVVVDATDHSSGERVALTTGAGAVLRQLDRAAQMGFFPFDCQPYQRGLDKKGRTDPLHLGTVDRF
jgi:hypothetical protein